MSKKSTHIWGANEMKDDNDISNRQSLLTQAMLLVSQGFCEQQNVFKVATSTSWSNVASVSLVLSWDLNPGQLSENQVSEPLDPAILITKLQIYPVPEFICIYFHFIHF